MMVVLQVKPNSWAAEKFFDPDEEVTPFIGRIELPFIGIITAKGQTEQEVIDRLLQRLEEFMNRTGIVTLLVAPVQLK
jgi:hypothetical protein